MRKHRSVLAAVIVAFLVLPSMAFAETRTAKEYMAEGIRAAYDNMHLVFEAYYDENGELEVQPTGHVAIYQEWDGEQLISRTYLGMDGETVNRKDGYAKVKWATDENSAWYVEFSDDQGDIVPIEGLNLVTDIKYDADGWTEWMTPEYDVENSCFTIGIVIIGKKQVGDQYRCSVEIEFSGVESTEGQNFWLRSQGSVDGTWSIGNIWNDALVSLRQAPEDTTYTYNAISEINENNKQGSKFVLGFRCDYWKSGKFRVHNVQIVKE